MAAKKKKAAAEQKILVEGNLEVHPDFALLALNPALFPLPVVYAASRKVLGKAYVLIDGDPSEELVVEMRPKKQGVKLLGIGRELANNLLKELEQYHHKTLPCLARFAGAVASTAQAWEQPHQEVRQEQREEKSKVEEQPLQETRQEQREEKEMSYLDDPLGIMKPWSEEKK